MDYPAIASTHRPRGRRVTLAVIDLGVNNVPSVQRAFLRVGVETTPVTSAQDLRRASLIVLPGVGAFRDGMAQLHRLRLIEPLRHACEEGIPMAGICLGMQLLAEQSEEHGLHEGLGLIPGRVVRLISDRPGYRIPNIGWCDVRVERGSRLVDVERDGEAAYFVHSYHLECSDADDVVASIEFSGRRVAAAVERGSLFGLQFHPEKSQDLGLSVLEALVHAAAAFAPA